MYDFKPLVEGWDVTLSLYFFLFQIMYLHFMTLFLKVLVYDTEYFLFFQKWFFVSHT